MATPSSATTRKKRGRSGPVLGYAKRLSPYGHKGRCGDEVAEEQEAPGSVEAKIQTLADLIRRARYCVAHTGAGLSTAAGIPDFRGQRGVWTREKQGHPLPTHEPFWANAVPTLGHMALKGLMEAGRLQYIVSQNIDGLHLRSGVPREKLSELHGNMLLEVCEACNLEVLRTCDVGGIGRKPTGRACPNPRCGSRLRDALLDWEEDLPEPDFGRAQDEAAKCEGEGGLALCLGTSLQMTPARDLPSQAGQAALVNLQPTEKDEECALVVRARIDDVLFGVTRALGLRVPTYERKETFHVHHQLSSRHRNSAGQCAFQATWRLTVGESTLFQDAPSGYLARVRLRLPPALRREEGEEEVILATQPFTHSARTVVACPVAACPVCSPHQAIAGSGAAGDDSGVWERVGVTVEFAPIPQVTAGATVLPSFTPAPWVGTYALPLHRKKDEGGRAETVTLVTMDYEANYLAPWLAPDGDGDGDGEGGAPALVEEEKGGDAVAGSGSVGVVDVGGERSH